MSIEEFLKGKSGYAGCPGCSCDECPTRIKVLCKEPYILICMIT